MSEATRQEQVLSFVRSAIERVFENESEDAKDLVLETFLAIQDVERFQKTNQVVKITNLLEQLSAAIAAIKEEK